MTQIESGEDAATTQLASMKALFQRSLSTEQEKTGELNDLLSEMTRGNTNRLGISCARAEVLFHRNYAGAARTYIVASDIHTALAKSTTQQALLRHCLQTADNNALSAITRVREIHSFISRKEPQAS